LIKFVSHIEEKG